MPALTIDIPTIPTRLLTKGEAARYCRLKPNRFSVLCPVRPVEIEKNRRVYDIKELDSWIDSLKEDNNKTNIEEILKRFD